MNCDKALDLLQVDTIKSYRARKAAILDLCREWGIDPIRIETKLENIPYVKMRFDYGRTRAKLAQYVILHSEIEP